MTRPVEDTRVTVVVMSRNRRPELLASLGRHRAPVVYVDNASTDGSAEAVRAAHPDVDVLALDGNAGAYARTLGARRARTPFVAFADDDSWWAPGALASAADALGDHPRVGAVNARILVGPEDRLDPVSAEMSRSPLAPPPGGGPGPSLLGFVGCATMVRAGAFLAVGGFDRVVRFPGEEERVALDLVSSGWHLCYLDDAVVHHHPSPVRHSPAGRVRGITRSHLLTGAMRLPWRRTGARAVQALAAGPATRRGLLDAVRDLPGALRQRRPVGPDVLAMIDRLDEAACAARQGDRV